MFNFAVEYPIRKVQESHGGLEMSDLNQVVVDADGTLLGLNIKTTKNKAEIILQVSKEIGLKFYCVGFEVLMAVSMSTAVFWVFGSQLIR